MTFRYHNLDAPLALAVLWLGVITALFLPDVVMAAKYGPSQQVMTDAVSSARDWWKMASNIAVFGGLIAAIIMYFIDKRWMWVAVMIAVIGGFGESFVTWILEIGGGSEHVIRGR